MQVRIEKVVDEGYLGRGLQFLRSPKVYDLACSLQSKMAHNWELTQKVNQGFIIEGCVGLIK